MKHRSAATSPIPAMQYRLSTLFLIFFNVAASLALFGAWGLWIAAIVLLAALCLNRAKNLGDGITWAVLIIFFGIICSWLLPAISSAREAARRASCLGHLKQIGLALHNYRDAYKHFPQANICDKNGKPLFSWRVEILPMMEYGSLYNSLKKDEPWNSPNNTTLLGKLSIPLYKCPSDRLDANDFTTNYVAVIGPGTAWREDGPVKLSDLPDGGSHTVMAVEVVNSGVHWAEPRDLTVEEALEGLKSGKGLRVSTAHPSLINVLFADGSIRSLPSNMPISVWRKLLAGEVKDFDNIDEMIDPNAPDMVDVSVMHLLLNRANGQSFSARSWLLSVALLFRRAIKSRRKPEAATQNPQMPQINADTNS